jgi:hypothetical protein
MLKNSNRNVLSVGRALPDRDYYVSEMLILKKKREIRTCSKNASFPYENQQKKMNAEKSFSS